MNHPVFAGGVGQAFQGVAAHRLAVFVKPVRRLDLRRLAASGDRRAGDMLEDRIERATADLAARLAVKVGVVVHDIGEATMPTLTVFAPRLLALHLRNAARAFIGEGFGRRQRAELTGVVGDKIVTQAGDGARAALLRNPIAKKAAVQMLAMSVIATERTIRRLVARFNLSICVIFVIRADDAAPAFLIYVRRNKSLLIKPRQHVVIARVFYAERNTARGAGFSRRHVKRFAYLRERVFAFGVEFHLTANKTFAPRLLVYGTRKTAVAHRVSRARIGVASMSNSRQRRTMFLDGRLVAVSIPLLKITGARLDDSGRRKRRRLRLGADVIQHHKQDMRAVGDAGGRLARHTIKNERAGVKKPALTLLRPVRRHVSRPRVFR